MGVCSYGVGGAEGVFFAGRAHSVGPRRVEGEVSGTVGREEMSVSKWSPTKK